MVQKRWVMTNSEGWECRTGEERIRDGMSPFFQTTSPYSLLPSPILFVRVGATVTSLTGDHYALTRIKHEDSLPLWKHRIGTVSRWDGVSTLARNFYSNTFTTIDSHPRPRSSKRLCACDRSVYVQYPS